MFQPEKSLPYDSKSLRGMFQPGRCCSAFLDEHVRRPRQCPPPRHRRATAMSARHQDRAGPGLRLGSLVRRPGGSGNGLALTLPPTLLSDRRRGGRDGPQLCDPRRLLSERDIGRANAALNILHVGGAFVPQAATGLIIAQWLQASGTYPAEAHQTAMAAILGLQVAAFAWFALSRPRKPVPAMEGLARRLLTSGRTQAAARAPHTIALPVWRDDSRIAQRYAGGWRLAAAASALLCLGLAKALSTTIGGPFGDGPHRRDRAGDSRGSLPRSCGRAGFEGPVRGLAAGSPPGYRVIAMVSGAYRGLGCSSLTRLAA
jgi:hypothetical protein